MTISCDVVFADDIRSEANGKMFLIGVYSDGLVPGSLPATFGLSIWARLRGLPEGEHKIDARISLGDTLLHSLTIAVKVERPDQPIQIILTGMPVSVQSPGTLSIVLSSDSLGQIAVGQLPIEAPRPIPNGPQVV